MAVSSTAAALIVGTGSATIAAIYGAIGYTARRFLSQQQANHADTLEALNIARDIQGQMPALGRRVKRLERGRKVNARNIDRLAELVEMIETDRVSPVRHSAPPRTQVRR